MDERFFDDLAKGLGNGTVSRGRALKLVGAAFLAVMVPSLFPPEALAITKKKCKRKGGVFLPQGNCQCAFSCHSTNSSKFTCHNNANCLCYKAVDGSGFCGVNLIELGTPCKDNTGCPGGVCAITYLNGCTTQTCSTDTDCTTGDVCINGICRTTGCVHACPT